MTTTALILHGETGSWDEILIAVVALAVLWVAVKLAGRKSVSDDDGEQADDGSRTPEREPATAADAAPPPPTASEERSRRTTRGRG